MRLIDADAYESELRKGTIITDDLYGMGIMSGNENAIRKIKEAPTIEADPVKHGRWVIEIWVSSLRPDKVFVRTVCSVCGERIRTESFTTDEWNDYKKDHYSIEPKNYCSNCGAKMDLEETE